MNTPQIRSEIETHDFISLTYVSDKNKRRVKGGTWKKLKNHKIYANWLGQQQSYKTMEDWYQITWKIINDNYGGGLIKKYKGSPYSLLKTIYPDYDWSPWKFTSTPQNYWDNIENQKIYLFWLKDILKIKSMEDCYQITIDTINNNYGCGLIGNKYNGSPYLLLKSIYPEYDWLPWKFTSTPQNYWNNIENQQKYTKWLKDTLEYKSMEDWYNISYEIIKRNYGSGLVAHKYNGSPYLLLKTVYPDYDWLPWKFHSGVPQNYWEDIENHKKYVFWLKDTLKIKSMEEWYTISYEIIKQYNGSGLISREYNGSPYLLLKIIYPDYDWLPWKFTSTPKDYWDNRENQEMYVFWLKDILRIKSMEDWYQITGEKIKQNYGGGLLTSKKQGYGGSPYLLLKTIYPDYDWDLSKFKKNYSQGQIEWLDYMILSIPDISHAINNGEYLIPNSRYYADGYSDSKNMILEYHGDFWHGNPKIYNQQDLNVVTKTTYEELYQNTLKKQRFCETNGYKYISIWESEWLRGKNSVILLQRKWKQFKQNNSNN